MAEHVQPDVHLVVKNIYSACDHENRNSAKVSKLIEYITPFMGENMSDLMELKNALDPNDDDPDISSEQFYKVMAEWTRKFNDRSSSFHNISVENLGTITDDKALPFVQSTPRASFGTKLKKGILDAPLLSNQSFQDNASGPTGLERSYYEDQINELNYQNRKFSDELLHIKLQLINTEEQNEVLQTELEYHKKQLAHEMEVIETLQTERRDFEELREALQNAQKQAERAEKKLQNFEKENQNLKHEITKLEREKQKGEEKLSNMHKKITEKVTLIVELETEMKVKDQDIANLEDVNNNLIQQLDEHKKIIYDYQESTRCMQVEKEKLQKIVKERMKKPNKIIKAPTSSGEYRRFSLPLNAAPPKPPPLPPKPQHKNTEQGDVPFTSAIKTDTFNFYNYESPYARVKRRSSTTALSPLAKPHNTYDTDTNKNYTPVKNKSVYSSITKTILDNSLTCDLNASFCKELVPGDYFKTPVKGDEADTLPTSSPCIANAILTSPNVSAFSINDSSEDEITRMQMSLFTTCSPGESLKSEILQAINVDDEDEENASKPDYNKRISYLESELKQHQRDKDRLEYEKLKLENDVHLAKIKQLESDNASIQKQVEAFSTQLKTYEQEKESFAKKSEQQTILFNKLLNEKAELVAQKKKIENCLNKLVAEKSKLEKDWDVLRGEKEELEGYLKSAQNEADELRNRLDSICHDFKKRLSTIQSERDELERFLNAARVERDETVERLSTMQGETKEVHSQNNLLRNEINKIRTENESLKNEKEIIFAENVSLKNQKEIINSENKSLKDEKEAIRAENESLKDEKNKIRVESESLKNEKLKIELENELLKSEKGSSTKIELSQLNKVSQENRLLCQENTELMKENETLNNSLKKLIDAINLKESAFEASNFQEQVERIQTAYNDLKIDLERIKSNNLEEIRVLQKNIAELIEEREALENEKDASEKHRIEMETENDYLKDRVETLECNLRDKGDVVNSLEGLLREKEGIISGLNEFSLEAVKRQKDKENAFINGEIILKQKVDEFEDKISLMCEEKAALESDNAVITAKLIDMTDEVQKFKTEGFKLEKEVEELNEALMVAKKEIRQLQQKMRSGDDKSKRGVNHDKMQMKLEKHIEKIDYLEEQLRNERTQNVGYRQEVQTKEQKYMADIKSACEEISGNRRSLKRSSLTLLKSWRQRLERIPSMDEILDQFDNGDSETKHLQLVATPLTEELSSLKREIQIVGNFMESLSKTSLLDESNSTSLFINSTNDTRIHNKFLLKPPTLVLKPMSPDSPNLEINALKYEKPPKMENGGMSPDSRADAIAKTAYIGAGDVSIERFATTSTSISEISQEESISLYEDVDDGILPLPIIKLDRVNEETEEMILSDEELAERFTACVAELTNERDTIKERLEAQYDRIRETEVNLAVGVKGILNMVRAAFPDSSGKQGEILIRSIAASVCRLCQLVEQFGAMKQESKRVESFTTMITHTTNLYLKLELAKRTSCEFISPRIKKQGSLRRFSNNERILQTSSFISREVFCSIITTGIVMSLLFCMFLVWCVGIDERLVSWEEIFRGFITKEYRNGPPPI